MPREPLRKLRPELFTEEQNLIDAFIIENQTEEAELEEEEGLGQVWFSVT